ncbi:DMT family transporter [Paenibacillus sp. S-38]|uniref:DMT family transporter n=1 Tax=Paenibacillus sp. S-38 TaxID=3416710 RepID=UPI003CF33839
MNRIPYTLLTLLATSLMGSSFAVGKLGLPWLSPLLLVGLRFTLAGGLMALWVRRRKLPLPAGLPDWGRLTLIGCLQTAGVMGCIFLSLQTITAGESSILTFLNPLLVVVLGTLFMGWRYRPVQWLGVLTGFAGVAVTLGGGLRLETGTLLGLGSAFSWAAATLLVKAWGARFHTWVLTAYQMLFGGLVLLGLSLLAETPKLHWNAVSVGVLLYLALLGSIVQFAAWYYLLSQGDPGRTSAFLFLAPFFGVLSGWLLLGEEVTGYTAAGGVLIFAGIFLVNWTFGDAGQRGGAAAGEQRRS